MYWPEELRDRTFSPSQVAEVTGISTDLQRQWAKRHHDFRLQPPSHEGRAKWFWAGVQALTVFGESLSDLRDAERAQIIAIGTYSDQITLYDFDYRTAADDLLIASPFEGAPWSGTTTARDFARMYDDADHSKRPRRTYLYNLSEMQRRLASKLAG